MHFDCSRDMNFEGFPDIEPDGRRIDHNRDPPGQNSVYIVPGDPERETYRLSTFKDFPQNVPINPCQFAVNGFYYTGYKDRLKCYSCGLSVEEWRPDDNPASSIWHKQTCEFKLGTDTKNIPIMPIVHEARETNASSSNATVPMFNTTSRPSNYPASLLYQPSTSNHNCSTLSLNGMDVTQFTAARERSNVQTLNTFQTMNQQITTNNNVEVMEVSTLEQRHEASSNQNFTNIFPCLNPINPHMRRTEARLQTFIDNSRLWPSYRLRATPEEIADAGMYFLGERDRVKCWYCNGGLQNWERDDDPWVEHAKWFPMCEYLLQRKGPDFVHRIVAQYPDLRRPTLRNPAVETSVNNIIRIVQSGPSISSSRSRSRTNQLPEIVDPREEIQKRNRKVEKMMTSSELVAQAKSLGFEDDVIRRAVKRKYEECNEEFSSFSSLVDAILNLPEDEASTEDANTESASYSGVSRSISVSNMTPSEELEEMRRLEESRNCKSCHSNRACMVFIPCGHLACCAECGSDVERCPICNCRVQERIKSFIV